MTKTIQVSYLIKISGWLSNFNLEYNTASFDHPGKRLHKKKLVTKLVKTTGKKRTYDVGKKESQDRVNRMNRDVYNISKSGGLLESDSRMKDYSYLRFSPDYNTTEESLNTLIDSQEKINYAINVITSNPQLKEDMLSSFSENDQELIECLLPKELQVKKKKKELVEIKPKLKKQLLNRKKKPKKSR